MQKEEKHKWRGIIYYQEKADRICRLKVFAFFGALIVIAILLEMFFPLGR